MSMITENTIVIKLQAEAQLLADLKKAEIPYRVSGVNCIFRNEEYIAYVFDCNGDQPWEIADSDTMSLDFSNVIATETNYGDGDGLWTQLYKDGIGYDTAESIAEIMKKRLSPLEYSLFAGNVAYTF